jgi:hypothetical protein
LFSTSRRLRRRKRTVTYHGQHFTMNRRISECDHKCETRNAEPEIGTDGSSQTRRNPRVDGYGSGFYPPRVCGSGFWPVLEPNRPVVAVQTRTAGALPGLVANTSLHQLSKCFRCRRGCKFVLFGLNDYRKLQFSCAIGVISSPEIVSRVPPSRLYQFVKPYRLLPKSLDGVLHNY